MALGRGHDVGAAASELEVVVREDRGHGGQIDAFELIEREVLEVEAEGEASPADGLGPIGENRPKLCVDLTNVPVAASKRYVKPEAGEGSGSEVSWLARAMLNCVKFDWNALLKCAECVDPSGSTDSLLTTSPLGPNRSANTDASRGGRDLRERPMAPTWTSAR